MLVRLDNLTPESVAVYRSSKLDGLGVLHGFSTRIGGVSRGPLSSLNLPPPTASAAAGPGERAAADADEPGAVRENYRRFLAAIGCTGRSLLWARQVHGCAVVRPADPRPTDGLAPPVGDADAIISDDPGDVATVRIADCVPVLLSSADGRGVAAVHAGWRGLVAGVIPRAVERLRAEHATAPPDLVAAIGPAIGVQHFEVSEDVADEFVRAGLTACVRRDMGPKPHVDLPGAALQQLLTAGLREACIDTTDRCTFRDADEFFSHRRDRGVTGRMVAAIGPRAG